MARLTRLRALMYRKDFMAQFYICPYCRKTWAEKREAINCRARCARHRWDSLKRENRGKKICELSIEKP